ncbi:ABC transporter substrate-binding protein [Butyrivibrio sp. NC3005]|uniref:ABC transporter substrate-binding protein n=1 Tax=Butyrivibrio sp. NC3005 TaxID=1280685 RepID=UPI00040F4A0D|nr:ABC transporter substrate-binding protein [Butyrivibrio sp. NC3005]
MKRKVLAALLSISMVASLAACGGGSKDNPKVDGSDQSADGESGGASDIDPNNPWAKWGDIDTSEHVKINYMVTGDKPSGEAAENLNKMLDKLNGILKEKVNAELEIYYIGWTDYLSNYNLTLAQMDGSVDLVGTASDWLDAWPNAKNGAFLELSEEDLKTYAPATYSSVSKEHWDLCKYDGEIYLMPEDNYAQWTNHGFTYRLDWAKEAGLTDGVKSWEDLTKYFKYVKENYPKVTLWDSDGTQFGQMAAGWVASHTKFVAIDGLSSAGLWGGTQDDLYTVVTPAYDNPEMMVEFAKLMKSWDEMGVWPTDVLNNTSSQNRDEYRVGEASVEQHHTQTWTDLCSHTDTNTIYKDNDKAESGFFYFGEETQNVVALSITHGAMAVSAASKNPERALMVYDLIRNDPECYKLFNYGIEGVSYEINDEGLRTTPKGYDSNTQNINGMTNYWWGRNDDIEIKDAQKNWEQIEKLYAEYDKIKIDYPYGQFVPNVDSIQAKIDNVNETYNNYMKQIAFGKYKGSAEDIVKEMDEALKKAGIEDVTKEIQKQFDELYKK